MEVLLAQAKFILIGTVFIICSIWIKIFALLELMLKKHGKIYDSVGRSACHCGSLPEFSFTGPTVWKGRIDSNKVFHDFSTYELWYHARLNQTRK